jgi:hypothetical protein
MTHELIALKENTVQKNTELFETDLNLTSIKKVLLLVFKAKHCYIFKLKGAHKRKVLPFNHISALLE